MCTNQLNLAWKAKVKSPGEKLVLVSLADQSNSDGVCWPGINHIAERTGLNRATVMRNIKRLESDGHLEKSKRTGGLGGGARSTIYQLTIAKVANCDDRVMQPRKSHNATRTIIEPSLSIYIGERNLTNQFKAFKAMRKQIKKPINPTGEKLLLTAIKKLEAEGHDIGDALDMATANCWLSVYAPKENKNGKGRQPSNGTRKQAVSPATANREAGKEYFRKLAEGNGNIVG